MNKRDRLIIDHIYLVKIITGKIYKSSPRKCDYDDLLQEGMIGLIQAAENYSKQSKAKFSTFAEHRIRGAILDYFREQNPLSRLQFDRLKLINYTENLLQTLGKDWSQKIVSEITKIPEKTISEIKIRNKSPIISVNEMEGFSTADKRELLMMLDHKPSALEIIILEEKKKFVRSSLHRLRPLELKIITGYFFKEMSMKEIGREMRITESRVSQIMKAALKRLEDVYQKAPHIFL